MNLISHLLPVTALMLAVSNLFMTFAWDEHLQNLAAPPGYVAALGMMGAVYFIFAALRKSCRFFTF